MQKRNFVRVMYDGHAEISKINATGEMAEPCNAKILDISAGGMYFEEAPPHSRDFSHELGGAPQQNNFNSKFRHER